MDITGTFNIEFLDLSEVDEYERNNVLASLQHGNSNNKFPWYIGTGDFNSTGYKAQNLKPSTLHSVQNSHFIPPVANVSSKKLPIPIIDPVNGLPVSITNVSVPLMQPNTTNGPDDSQLNNQYYAAVPQYFPPPVVTTIHSAPVHMPQNFGNFPVPNATALQPPIYPGYIPPTYPEKAFYGVPPAPAIFVTHQNVVGSNPYYVQNSSQPDMMHIEKEVPQPATAQEIHYNDAEIVVQTVDTSATQSTVSLSADTPVFVPKNTQNLASVQPPSTELQNATDTSSNVEKKQEASPEEPVVTAQQKEEVFEEAKPSAPWASKKSWASLFNNKQGSGGSPTVNGMTKPALVEAVKQNNDGEVSCPIRNPRKNQFIDPDCCRMGEFLANYIVDGKAISLQPRGLVNQSNYCYINSILQALIACPPMYNLLSGLSENISSNTNRKPTPVIDGMCRFVKEFKHLPANMRVNNRRSEGKKDQKKDQGPLINTDIPFEPSWIYKMLNGIRTDLIEGRQEDAEEFLGCLLNNLNDEMLELIKLVKNEENEAPTTNQGSVDEDESWQVMGSKNKGSVLRKTVIEKTPISDIFGGSLKSRIVKAGDHVTENTQPFFTLQLNIEKVKTVREALEALTAKNQLEGVTSSKTNEKVEAWQQAMLDELPIVLILHLKCFDFKMDGCTKIVQALEFPIDLKIEAKLISSKTTSAKEKQYKLFAVVYHDGKEATKGHYITDAFHVGYSSWLRYDDAAVKQVQEEHVLKPVGTRVPYLLFYRRSDTIRSR